MKNKNQFVLASQSPRREELVAYLDIPFNIEVSHAEEIINDKLSVHEIAMDIALQKGKAIAYNENVSTNRFILAADTIVILDDDILGKPQSIEDARNMLVKLSGKTHQVVTGVAFIWKEQPVEQHCFYEQTQVTFEKIDPNLLENYLQTKDSLDKAGAYGIQGPSLTFIKNIQGSYSNVVGLPLNKVISEFEKKYGQSIHKAFSHE